MPHKKYAFIMPLLAGLSALLLSACQQSAASQSAASGPDTRQHQASLDKYQGVPLIANTLNNTWYRSAEHAIANKPLGDAERGQARNIILFLGDGMSIATVTAARILAGQRQGHSGEEHSLSFESFPYTGLSKTYNVNAQTPDSAGTMTAIMSGLKTDTGVLGVDEGIDSGNCQSLAGTEVVTTLELAELAGKSTGIVSTARITHATPAATYAKSPDRDWEDDSSLPSDAKAAGCEDIASQLIHFEKNLKARIPGANINGIEVVLGGGRRGFISQDDPSGKGNRLDGQNLIEQWQKQYPDGHYLENAADLQALDPSATGHIFGLFDSSHLEYEADRDTGAKGEPSLTEMTAAAIKRLSKNPKGYFLMVEGGRIDHAHHAGNAFNALNETIAFADAVATAVSLSQRDDTLIIVTADHGHAFSISGYPKRGNPILGKVIEVGSTIPAQASDGMPYTTLGYRNGRGFQNLGSDNNADTAYQQEIQPGRHNLDEVDTQSSGFHQEALIPLAAETHSGEDVAIYAIGPGAALVSGSNEQNLIFHVMNYAAQLLDVTPPAHAK
ncbi:MAG: alkaline phosphatase [Zhongshania sp.]|uniref:alkaline phosphatase n=1 Tax=Zhongshania sp. TaxID=1971902 RepID=UPI0026314ADD|nr:alkaline phosphatase [Zhongshania sp.]MDF1691321.1 alkaline phosphatase [Zhongshania sp.]